MSHCNSLVHCWWSEQLEQTIVIGESETTENLWKSVLLSLTWFTCVCPFQMMVLGLNLCKKDQQKLCKVGERRQFKWLLCGVNQSQEQPPLDRIVVPAHPLLLVLSSLDPTATRKKTLHFVANPLHSSKALFQPCTTLTVQTPKVHCLVSRVLSHACRDLYLACRFLCPT